MVHELLARGAENARTGRELCEQLGINPRQLTAMIEKERREGRPICASTGTGGSRPGYFLAKNRQEMEHYCKRLRRRAGEIFKTRRACLTTMEGLPPDEREAG